MNFDPILPLDLDSRRQSLVHEVPHALRELATLASMRTMPVCMFLYTNGLNGAFDGFVDDSVYLAIAIPESAQIDWAKQVSDWLIPHCEVSHEGRTARALVLLGDGPIAVPTAAIAPVLFGAEKDIHVVFVTSAGALAVKYRWNENLLVSIHAADVAAERMEYDEYQSERMIALGFPMYGCCNGQTLVATPVDALEDGGGQLQVVNSTD